MVSHANRRRARLSALILALLLGAACSRHADIAVEVDGGTTVGPNAPKPDGGVPPVEAALDDPSFAACSDRPVQSECAGTNDFPCDFESWLPSLAQACQTETSCVTNGWLEIDLGDDGCASEIRMEEPNEAFVECLVRELGAARCPCAGASAGHFLGVGNDGCSDEPTTCGSGEFPCPSGEECVEGFCVSR